SPAHQESRARGAPRSLALWLGWFEPGVDGPHHCSRPSTFAAGRRGEMRAEMTLARSGSSRTIELESDFARHVQSRGEGPRRRGHTSAFTATSRRRSNPRGSGGVTEAGEGKVGSTGDAPELEDEVPSHPSPPSSC